MLVAVASPVQLLDCDQIDRAIQISRTEPVPEPRTATDVQLLAHHSLCGGWEIVDLWQSLRERPRAWHARRKTMKPSGQLIIAALDEATCPALIPVLMALDRITVSVSIIAPPAPSNAAPAPVPMADGTQYSLRVLSAGQRDQSRATVTVASSNGPVANWAEAELSKLDPCWRRVSPAPDTPATPADSGSPPLATQSRTLPQ